MNSEERQPWLRQAIDCRQNNNYSTHIQEQASTSRGSTPGPRTVNYQTALYEMASQFTTSAELRRWANEYHLQDDPFIAQTLFYLDLKEKTVLLPMEEYEQLLKGTARCPSYYNGN